MDLNLASLSPDQLVALKAALDGLTDTSGRSPLRPRQLHDLRLMPTKDDPRPTFVWSAESPRDRDVSKTTPYPKLMWHRDTAEEITVYSAEEEDQKLDVYTPDPPAVAVAIDPMEAIQDALTRLSPEERAVVLAGQKQTRLASLQAQLSALSPEDLAVLLGEQTPPKRKPGRPRKDAAA